MKMILMTFMFALSSFTFGVDSNSPSHLDDLIRGEMAAVKSYDTVISKLKDKTEIEKLTTIRKDHMNAVEKLRAFATKDVKDEAKTAGPWGTFTQAYAGGAKLFGDATALKALTQGEEHGIKEYKQLLGDKEAKPALKDLIKTQLLPKQMEHIQHIKSFM